MKLSMQQITKPRAALLSCMAVILTPYLSRLIHGISWMMEYLPANLMALLFFAGFASIPAAVIWALIYKWPGPFWQHCFWVTLGVTALFLACIHHGYDLSADAQAAIGLIIFPTLSGFLAAGVYTGTRLLLWYWYR